VRAKAASRPCWSLDFSGIERRRDRRAGGNSGPPELGPPLSSVADHRRVLVNFAPTVPAVLRGDFAAGRGFGWRARVRIWESLFLSCASSVPKTAVGHEHVWTASGGASGGPQQLTTVAVRHPTASFVVGVS
jgi:hypothetical protein